MTVPAASESTATVINGETRHTLFVANGNDFVVASAGNNQFYVFAVSDADLARVGATCTAQNISAVPESAKLGHAGCRLGHAGLFGAPQECKKVWVIAQIEIVYALFTLTLKKRLADQYTGVTGNADSFGQTDPGAGYCKAMSCFMLHPFCSVGFLIIRSS